MHPTQRLLARNGFRFSHSLGQNFIFDEALLFDIVDAAGLPDDANVLEIGPGAGGMTALLCQRAKTVAAIEIDRGLEPVLRETLSGYDNLRLVFGDFLKLNIEQICCDAFGGAHFFVVANLPYYITTPVLMRLLEADMPIRGITVMVQKEVAQRIAAKPGGREYGVLSIAVQYRMSARIAINVPAAAFVPPPKVDSCVLVMRALDEPPVRPQSEAAFFRLVRSAFHMRRKTLANNLISAYPLSRPQAEDALVRLGISKTARAEQLSLGDFARLSDALSDI